MARQEERRAETRTRLLEAAADLFARHGIEGASVDAIADAADRTSGALYNHFGSKEGLLTALLDRWMGEVAAVTEAELVAAASIDEQLRALWRNVARPTSWLQLEHELWLYATRNDDAAPRVADRYRFAAEALAGAIDEWDRRGQIDPPVPPGQLAPLIVGLLAGLEMQHRLDPSIVDDEAAVTGLRALLGVTDTERT